MLKSPISECCHFFQNQWIESDDPTSCPSCSLDITHLDFSCSQGHTKNKMFSLPVPDIETLKVVMAKEMFESTWQKIKHHLNVVGQQKKHIH